MSELNKNIEELLSKINIKIEHQNEIEKLKGEKFNIFSILKMETKENATHSAFLGELLNPKGTHLKGNIFLDLFLKSIGNDKLNINKQLDVNSTTVTLEYAIGFSDYDKKTGGRIDIYLKDKYNHTISIENKIYAQDQYAQIERYYNHNKLNNTVYYLTLFGDDPTFESKGELEQGKHYYKISYKVKILEWLNSCLKEAADSPILRETIKQYIILIKKFTHTMENTEEEKLKEIILQNFEAASCIAAKFNIAKDQFCEEIRQKVFDKLKEDLKDNYSIKKDLFQNKISQIKINPIKYKDSETSFTIENFNEKLMIGIFNSAGLRFIETEDVEYWQNKKPFDDFEDHEINLSESKTISRLNMDKNFRDGFIKHIVNEIKAYVADENNIKTLIKLNSILGQ